MLPWTIFTTRPVLGILGGWGESLTGLSENLFIKKPASQLTNDEFVKENSHRGQLPVIQGGKTFLPGSTLARGGVCHQVGHKTNNK